MAAEFVDLYEVLELPVDADRNTLRKRVNELYLDAQRNLDHRNFATRVKFQELFEVTLPQARYILLDDGRRDEYNRIVHAFRAAKNGELPAPQTPAAKSAAAPSGNFALGHSEPSIPGERAPVVEPLPPAEIDPAQLAQEREELWKKWKSGLEAALTTEGDKPKSRAATTSAPTSFTTVATPETPPNSAPAAPTTAPTAAVQKTPVAAPPLASAPQPAARPKVAVSFDSGEKQAESPKVQSAAFFENEEQSAISAAEIETRRTEHRRRLMKEVLVNVGLIWGIIGAAIVVVPGFVALVAAAGHFYPRGGKALLSYPPQLLWGIGLLLIGVAAFFASRELSKNMRRKTATQLSFLSYEDLLKRIGKS